MATLLEMFESGRMITSPTNTVLSQQKNEKQAVLLPDKGAPDSYG